MWRMAKRQPIHAARNLTLKVNDKILNRLEALANDGFLGNLHEDVALVALRVGIRELEKKDPQRRGSE